MTRYDGFLPGERVLDAVRSGRLWVNLVGISEWDARFSELADQIFGEFSAQVPGLEVVKRKLGVLMETSICRNTCRYACDCTQSSSSFHESQSSW